MTKSTVIPNARDVVVASSTAGVRHTSPPCSRSPGSLVLQALACCSGILNHSELWRYPSGVSSEEKNTLRSQVWKEKSQKKHGGKGSSVVWAMAGDSPHPRQDRDMPGFREWQASQKMSL